MVEPSSLSSLLEEISFRRRKDLKIHGESGQFSVNHNTTYWTDLFVRHFLFQSDYQCDGDDLLFFIRKNLTGNSTEKPFQVEVFRRDSRRLPIGDPDVDWEETIYINLIIHQMTYNITVAVCSRTSPKNLQILKRYTQRVYATPSRRKMDGKGEQEEMIYPYISFSVDNFEDMFKELNVRDGESLGIELTAQDHEQNLNLVLFSASVPYETIKRVYEARTSQTVRKRLSQTNLFSIFSGKYGNARVEYVRLIGPQGQAELAVARGSEDMNGSLYAGSRTGCDTPSSEPGESILDQLWDSEDSDFEDLATSLVGFKRGHQRRQSDPSSTLHDFMRLGILDRPGKNKPLADVSNHIPECMGEATCEIYAGDLLDEFEETKYNPLWTMKGYTQIFHSWRESKRMQSIPLGAFISYITLPWWSIMKDVLDNRHQPLLTF